MGSAASLSCTDWFNVSSGVVSAGFGWSAFNQAAYLGNVQMNQAQKYQEKNYQLSWVAIAREDVRDMMAISVTRINSYLLVGTLILAVATEAILTADIQEHAPDFLAQAFWVSMGISILFFGLSIMFSVKGQNAAFLNTMRLLTWEIRPETPAVYGHDYMQQAQQLEKDGLGALFRLPGRRTKFQRQAAKSWKDVQQDAKLLNQLGPTVQGSGSQPPDSRESASELEHLCPESRQLLYLARFGHFMQLWQPFDTHARHCIGLGLVSLTQGAAYFCLGRLTPHRKAYEDMIALSMIAILSYLIFAICQQNLISMSLKAKLAVNVLFLSGPSASTLAAMVNEPSWVRKIFAPIGCLCHCAVFMMAYFWSVREARSPAEDTKKFTTGPAGQQFPENWRERTSTAAMTRDLAGPLPLNGISVERTGADPTAGAQWDAEEAAAIRIQNTVSLAVRGGLSLSALLWFCIFVMTVLTQIELNPFRLALPMRIAEEINITWPSGAAVWPHALACAGDQVFLANRYQVFRAPAAGGPAVREACALEGPIGDLAAACDGAGRCRPLVLLEGTSRLVDCGRPCGELALLQERRPADRIAFLSRGGEGLANGTLLARHGDEVVEYAWAEDQPQCGEARRGWSPLWRRARAGNASDVDVSEGRLFLFGLEKHLDGSGNLSNVIEARNLETEEQIGKWNLPPVHGHHVAGCAAGEATALLLLSGRAPSMLRVDLPG